MLITAHLVVWFVLTSVFTTGSTRDTNVVLLSMRKGAFVCAVASQLWCGAHWCILLFRGGNSGTMLVFPCVMEGPDWTIRLVVACEVFHSELWMRLCSWVSCTHDQEMKIHQYRKGWVQGTAQAPLCTILWPFNTSLRLRNHVNHRFIQNDTACADWHFFQAERWKPSTQRAVLSCEA